MSILCRQKLLDQVSVDLPDWRGTSFERIQDENHPVTCILMTRALAACFWSEKNKSEALKAGSQTSTRLV